MNDFWPIWTCKSIYFGFLTGIFHEVSSEHLDIQGVGTTRVGTTVYYLELFSER